MGKAKFNKKSFTIIELLVVIAIMSILAAAFSAKFMNQTSSMRIAAVAEQIKGHIELAQERTKLEQFQHSVVFIVDGATEGGGTPLSNDNYYQVTRGALKFDGSGDYVDCGSDSSLKFSLSDNFTVEAWVNGAFDSTNDGICGNGWDEPGYHLRITTDNKVRFVLVDDGSNYHGAETSVVSSGWHHIVGVWDGSDVITYLDGSEDSSDVSAGTVTDITSSNNFKIGDIVDQTLYFNGAIEEVCIYSCALDANEIKQNYQLGEPASTSDLIAQWKFDDINNIIADGTTSDSQGTNDGTVNGATLASIEDPLSGNDAEVDFDTNSNFTGVHIDDSCSGFTSIGDNSCYVSFNNLGEPSSSGSVTIKLGNASKTISVAAVTGKVSIE